ncbi:hypothetical protein GBAR_LOCUS22614 [Geodia barretti]|nr:hypothetical protein GBAR_LOCUS22614 [Geodia barretti]
MSGFGENGSRNGTGEDQSDSSEPLSTGALIGICVGGGVVLLTVLITALCVVCCIWKRRRQKSVALYDPEVYTTDNKPSPPSSHHSSISSAMAARLLSTASSKAKKIPQPRDSDLTAAISAASNSNPLYNSSSIAYLPSGAQDGKQKMIAETPLSAEAPPIISVSSRRHSLGYVEMQSAGPARPGGIHASHSMENFTDSTNYSSVRDGTGFKLPFAPPSYTPPRSSPPTSSLPTSRHHYLHPDRPPAPSPPHSHPHTPPTKKPKPTKRDVQEEEDRGGEDDYVDPKLFLEDKERVQEEEDRPEDEYEEMKDQTDFFFSISNTAYRNSTMSEDNPTADSAHQPHPATDHTSSSPTQPLYGNILPQDEGEEGGGGPYISDSYEPVNEFLGNAPDTNERATLLATTDGRKISRTAPSTPSKHAGSTVSTKTNKITAQNLSRGLKESYSFGRKLSMDDQYVEVMSPVRKTKSLKPRSARVTHDDIDLDVPELEYENVIPGTTIWGNENETESADSLHATEVLSVGGQGSSPGEREQKTTKKSPSPTPKAKTSPKPKPKPHPSQLPQGKPRSKSHDAATHTSTQPQMRIVVGGQSSSQDRTRPHFEEMVFPTHPIANGNVVTHSNVAMGNGGVDSRWRSTTVPVGGSEGGEGEEEEEGGEMLYVNVGDSIVDVGGEELYENVSSHDHLT